MQGKVEISGINTSKLQTLTSEQMQALLRRTKEGDEEARQKLVLGNLRLVLSVIQRFSGRGEEMSDLFQIGVIGLLKAIANFDVEKGNQFSTYGVPMIAGEVRRFLRDSSAIRVSRSVRDAAYKILQCREALQRELQCEPKVEQIAERLGISREEVVYAMDAISTPASLYDPVYSDGGDPLTVMDQIHDTKNTDERWMERIALRDAISVLPEREKRILALRFYDGKTQMEVAKEIGISQAQVSRLEKGALGSIRKSIAVQA